MLLYENLKIRRAGPDDLARAANLTELAWTASNEEFLPGATIAMLTVENSISGLIASRSQELWLAEIDAELVAVVGVDSSGYVWACYVHPSYQRNGIGEAVMSEVKTYFQNKGLSFLIRRSVLSVPRVGRREP